MNSDGLPFRIAGLFDGERMICQLNCDDMQVDEIFARLEELAARYESDGIATDEINGAEHSYW